MEFALSEEQAELVSMIGSLLDKRADSAAVRAAIEAPLGYDEALWATLCEQVGVAALAVPEEYDGAGASLFEGLLVLEALGRSLAPTPLLSSLIAAQVVLTAADDQAKARLLPRIAMGEIVAVATVDENGTAEAVLDADRAAVVLVINGADLYEVDAAAATTTWRASMDQTLRLADLQVDLSAAVRIGDGNLAARSLAQVGAAGVAALAQGCAARGLEMTVAYTKERVQFGRPIGSFQALKHRMADLLVLVEMGRSAFWAASYALSVGAADAEQLGHVAASYCTDAAAKVAAETVQLHGGIAITWEHDAHLVFKRAHAVGQLFGSAHRHRAALTL